MTTTLAVLAALTVWTTLLPRDDRIRFLRALVLRQGRGVAYR
jgi:hypothetical protein